MTNLLIVDDEAAAIRAMRYALDWEKYGITEVFTAHSMKSAQGIFEEFAIDMMLCDIEMPRGSGLDLLNWVRDNHHHTECVFLTCHADFHFSQKAIQLGSLDYLLKPVPTKQLAAVVEKALNKINRQSKLIQNSQNWLQHQPQIMERFWLDVINRTIPSNVTAIYKVAVEKNITLIDQSEVLPVLIKVKRWRKVFTVRDERIMELALSNAAADMITDNLVHVLSLEKGTMLAIISGSQSQQKEEFNEKLDAYIQACHHFFYCDLSCYKGEWSPIEQLAELVDKLVEREKNNVAFDNKVIELNETVQSTLALSMPDMRVWSALLGDGKKDPMLGATTRYLIDLSKSPGVNADVLHRFHQDMLQMFYSLLQEKGIQAHQFFQDPASRELSIRAGRSVTDMIAWVHHMTAKTMEHLNEKSESIVDKVKRYVQSNLERDLTREDIANYVYLNPDYLTRLIKKETGLPISDYVLQERMKLAKELFSQTDMPVKAVAKRVGFATFSHFSKVFRKHTGLNPVDYRYDFHKRVRS